MNATATEPDVNRRDLQLWLRARDECEKSLGHLPSNSDLVDFAQSKAGKYIRHLFPFDDVEGSAAKHWLFLAGCYTRQAKILFASDPNQAPTQVRALHIVKLDDGTRGVARIDQVAAVKSWTDQVVDDAYRSMQTFLAKYQSLSLVLKDEGAKKKLARAVLLAAQAAELLRRK